MAAVRAVFSQVNLIVSDMSATVTFYRLLGLEVPDTEPEWQDHHRAAQVGDGLELEFDSIESVRRWNRGWQQHDRSPGARGVFGFRVDGRAAVDELHERLTAAGHRSQQPPYDTFWGSRYAIVEDPDGNAVGIMSPADGGRSTEPPTLDDG